MLQFDSSQTALQTRDHAADHRRLLRGPERVRDGRHGLHGQGAPGETAPLLSRHRHHLHAGAAEEGRRPQVPGREAARQQGGWRCVLRTQVQCVSPINNNLIVN